MKQCNHFLTFEQEDCRYRFLPSGDIFTFTSGGFLINQFRGNAKDGSVNNIYLRIYRDGGLRAYPLLGIRSGSRISHTADSLRYSGCVEGISYEVVFRPHGSCWFWDVTLCGANETVDLVYGQDLGVNSEGGVYSNELYSSQYLGHTVFENENGYVICSRQNLPVGSSTPYLQQGVLGCRAIHYATDGLQFFGLSVKETQYPEALSGDLPDVNLQYEFAYTALQTEQLTLAKPVQLSFYGLFSPNHPEAVTEIEYQQELQEARSATAQRSDDYQEEMPVVLRPYFGAPYASPSFSAEETAELFPERLLEEEIDGRLVSFFTPDHAHVVTKEKELSTQRPHGTIIITPPDTEHVGLPQISSTQYMYGVFNSHVVTGNTDLQKLLSTPRGFLNLLKNSGQRIYVRLGDSYRLLTLPGLFEMGMNYSRWFYKMDDDLLTITAYTSSHKAELTLEVSSASGKAYDFIVTNQLVLGTHEYSGAVDASCIPGGLRFALHSPVYPDLSYDLICPGEAFTASDDRIFFADDTPFDETFLTLSFSSRSALQLIIRAVECPRSSSEEKASFCAPHTCSGEEVCEASDLPCFETEKANVLSYYSALTRGFHLESAAEEEHAAILNETIWWYTHNAMIHFSMPHGLEQPGGAAWGTRDICQGPMEFFLSTQHYALAKDVLLRIFAHQNLATQEWPQWFMFDQYQINAGECHGDVIFWPLKCVADYLEATGDYEILDELLPYDDAPGQKETLLSHIRLALSNIRETRMIGDTGLITYAGGDWDDTLQPANEELKQKLVSAWTVALAYQTFTHLSEQLRPIQEELSAELLALSAKIRDTFRDSLICDDVIAGFLACGEPNRCLLHPTDDQTGIHYRLLPMTRSIIAELVSKEQAKKNEQLIQEHLSCPDGVRLMDHPADYNGGVSHLFKRAEQAANVGREISLQYTHAHIRYVEAMAKLGRAQKAWDALFVVNPILISHSVPNAALRQSNMYFSSSEGDYTDRYDYAEHFDLLRSGSITVKGGWRLYSSGPGIYLRQLIGNVLGIRFVRDGLVIDPVLPASLDQSEFVYECFGRTMHFRYHVQENGDFLVTDHGTAVPAQELPNPYRRSALLIRREVLAHCSDTLDLYLTALEDTNNS